jgi:uncharacterized phage protein (TIGR01671 family)
MREIKFRAWHKQNKMFFKDDLMDGSDWFAVQGDGKLLQWRCAVGFEPTDDIEIQQFTGLLDKNGKEIYEGDIVRHSSYRTDEIRVIEWGPTEDYEGGETGIGFNISPIETEEDPERGMRNEIEVIGNVYESPELLKPVKK